MKKALNKLAVLILALLQIPINISAQEIVEVDTINVDEAIVDTLIEDTISDYSQYITQYELKECDWVDICQNPRYAVVTRNGKKGIYDLILQRNITEIEFRGLGYSKTDEDEDGTSMTLFYAKKGIKLGILGVASSNNSVFELWMDDSDEVYSLEECTTIDENMMGRAMGILGQFISQHQMNNAQIVVLDATSGHLKTWVAMDADMKKENAGKLLAHSCSASLTIPFRNGKPLKNRQQDATSPFMMAAGYNSLVHDGKIIIPTLKADSVEVDEAFSSDQITNVRKELRINRKKNTELSWLADDTEFWGYAALDDIYSEEDYEKSTPVGKQIQFAGVFPTKKPRYTICVVAEKSSPDTTLAEFEDVVNPLVEWLLKKQQRY